MEFAMSGLDRNTFEKGKTVIRVKGVNITKQTFPLKGDLFQDSVLQVSWVDLFQVWVKVWFISYFDFID